MKVESHLQKISELNDNAIKCYQNGELENAKTCFEELLKLNPFDKDTYYNLAKVYSDLGEKRESINILLELVSLGDEEDSIFELLGDTYLETNNFSEALICYERVKNGELVKEKAKILKESFKKEQDKLYLQYMNYPYPNKWATKGIPDNLFELVKYNGPERRKRINVLPFVDINYIQLKYWEHYKDLTKIRVLNAGCGTGEGLITSAVFYPEVEYVAIDMSENSINIAKEHAKKLGVKNITFIQKNIMDVNPKELGYFDIIMSTGVLHHLYNPLDGIKKLKNVLKDDGMLLGMVYATIGRREVYDFREIFDNLFSEVELTEYKLGVTKLMVSYLQPWQPLNRIKTFDDLNYGDQGIIDLLLNENETSYNTNELTELFEKAEMNIDFYDNNYLDPAFEFYNIESQVINRRLTMIDRKKRMRIGELLNGGVYKHNFMTYKKTFSPKGNYLLSENWINTFPILWHSARLKKDEKGFYLDLSFRGWKMDNISGYLLTGEKSEDYVRYDLTKWQYEFLEECKGQMSIGNIIEDEKSDFEISGVKRLIFELGQIGVLFLSNNKECSYKG